ncbi:sensor histidine kinase [Mycobacterium sp. PDNC021]|uniref:sensor histidine kinase n=1 Tax=Mycobacterium sp. PDNC021 TaxID=3391399 RepID=UPI003AAC0EED
MIDALASDASRRNMLRQAKRITLFMRHGANLLVCAVVVVLPPVPHELAARVFAGALGAWAVYRLVSPSHGSRLVVVDYITTLAACLATPVLVAGPHFYLSNSVPVVVAGTAVVSFSLSMPAAVSLAMSIGIAAAFAVGSSGVVGWSHVGDIFNLYYFALQWVTGVLVRMMVLRVADSVDAARADRVAAELQQEVATAVREYDREQTRLLHDTVASTLLMVGDGTTLAPERVAAQARRDLEVFSDRPWAPRARADLVAALRHNADHIATPMTYAGAEALWLDGVTVAAVAAAAREVLNNVDRHSGATGVTITVAPGQVRIADDGRGFDATQPVRGHGIANSITARMHRIGGDVAIHSRPGYGTTVELRWHTDTQATAEPPADPERLIERTRAGYGLALIAYACVNLLAMVPAAASATGHPQLQWALAAISAAATLAAIAGVLGWQWVPRRANVAALVLVSVVQSMSLPVDLLGTAAQWPQNAIGWCVLPLLLNERVRVGVVVLIGCWTIPGVYALIRDPSAHTVANLGYGTASILLLQLCALLFDNLIRRAAVAAGAEAEARVRLVAADRIADAVQAEYRRRYADLADTIRPLLLVLASGGTVDATIARSAQIEYQRLRALFDQSAAFDHVLMRALRPVVDGVQDRGVAVSTSVAGTLPVIDDVVARRLTHVIHLMLTAPSTFASARITVSGDAFAVKLSVICRGVQHPEILTEQIADGEDQLDLTVLDDTVWITVRHQLTGGAPEYALAGNAP